MGPLDRLKYIIAEWQSFIQHQKTYKYHGVYQRCPKDWYFSPIGWYDLLDLTPPVFGVYDNSLTWSKDWALVYLYFKNNALCYRGSGVLQFRTMVNQENYDTVRIQIKLTGQNCSLQVQISYLPFQLGVYKEDIPYWNYTVWQTNIATPWGYYGMSWGKYGIYMRPDLIDYWCWKIVPNRYSLNYIINFKYNSNRGDYIMYDNLGHIGNISNNTSYQMDIYNWLNIVTSNYPGIAFRYNGVTVDSIKFYSDIWK